MSIPTSSEAPSTPSRKHWRIGLWVGLVLVLILVATLAIFESRGWPMLRRPAENWVSQKLDREVLFEGSTGRWRMHLLGGVRIEVERLEIAAPPWSTLGPTLVAGNAKLSLRWRDLWSLWRGQPLIVESLEADTLAVRAQRLADGRASWTFGNAARSDAKRPQLGLQFEQLVVRKGTAVVDDKINALSMVAGFALRDGAEAGKTAGVQAEAEGRYRGLPLTAKLQSGSALPWLSPDPKAPAVPVALDVKVGDAALAFEGQVRDLMVSQGLKGRYTVKGSSLAAVGRPLGVTLPTTPPFAMRGSLTREGARWSTAVEQATIGRSQLMGDFVYDRPGSGKPKLSGELRGPVLWLADLGPAIGTAAPGTAAPAKPNGRVLPDRRFDLPSLRAMDADVKVRLDRLESGSTLLQAVKPLHANLLLQDGVLLLDQIDARLAQGRLAGRIQLDGREAVALLDTKLTLSGLLLEQWLLIKRQGKAAGTPYVTGRLGGQLQLKSRGRSTAELLGSSDGRILMLWRQGTASHLLVEAAGIDIAQSLGVLIKGDDPLPVSCGVADLQVKEGLATAKLFLIDTSDSVLDLEGAVSLASERMGLTMRVHPKDFSPLTLRTPVLIGGTFGKPAISLDKGPLLKRLVPSIALATVSPLAGLLPLLDAGGSDMQEGIQDCRQAMEKATPRKAP